MESAAMTNRTLTVEGMSGDACVKKVGACLQNVKGVTEPAVSVGAVTMKADESGCKAACAAIGNAGYKAHESNKQGGSGDTGAPRMPGATDAPLTTPSGDAWTNEGGKGRIPADGDRLPTGDDRPSRDAPRMPEPNPAVAHPAANRPIGGGDQSQRQPPAAPGKPARP